jgi:hypothetical protein
MAEGHLDMQVFEHLRCGFPLDVGHDFVLINNVVNHSSAVKFQDQVEKYINNKLEYGALKRANTSNLNFLHKLPLMSCPKDGDKRRLILDLSWPKYSGASVKACVPENRYLNTEFTLKLPTEDSISHITNDLRYW